MCRQDVSHVLRVERPTRKKYALPLCMDHNQDGHHVFPEVEWFCSYSSTPWASAWIRGDPLKNCSPARTVEKVAHIDIEI